MTNNVNQQHQKKHQVSADEKTYQSVDIINTLSVLKTTLSGIAVSLVKHVNGYPGSVLSACRVEVANP